MEATCRNKLACMPDHCFCVDRSVNDEHVALNVLTGRGSQSDSCDTRLTPSCQEGTHHSATSELVTEIKNLAEAKANSHTSLQSNATMKLKSHGEPFGQLHRKFRWSLRSPDNAAAVSLSPTPHSLYWLPGHRSLSDPGCIVLPSLSFCEVSQAMSLVGDNSAVSE